MCPPQTLKINPHLLGECIRLRVRVCVSARESVRECECAGVCVTECERM